MSEQFKALNENNWVEFAYLERPKCPHCGEVLDSINNDKLLPIYCEGEHKIECTSCEGEFLVSTVKICKFSTHKQEPK